MPGVLARACRFTPKLNRDIRSPIQAHGRVASIGPDHAEPPRLHERFGRLAFGSESELDASSASYLSFHFFCTAPYDAKGTPLKWMPMACSKSATRGATTRRSSQIFALAAFLGFGPSSCFSGSRRCLRARRTSTLVNPTAMHAVATSSSFSRARPLHGPARSRAVKTFNRHVALHPLIVPIAVELYQ